MVAAKLSVLTPPGGHAVAPFLDVIVSMMVMFVTEHGAVAKKLKVEIRYVRKVYPECYQSGVLAKVANGFDVA